MSALALRPAADYIFSLLLAAICGTVIGIERSFRRKEAGARTHAILSLASALFMLLSKYAFADAPLGADPTMIACQIVMGINFIGTGLVFNSRRATTGLATTAGVWGAAAIGMACGARMYLLGILATLLIVGLQLILNKLYLGDSTLIPQEIHITMVNTPNTWRLLQQKQQELGIDIVDMQTRRREEHHLVALTIHIRMRTQITTEDALHFMDQHKDIKELSI